jgi:hypothetical protein
MKKISLFLLSSFALFNTIQAHLLFPDKPVVVERIVHDSLHSHHASDSVRFHNWKAGISFSNLGESIPSLEVRFPYLQTPDPYEPNQKNSAFTMGVFLERRIRHSLGLRISGGFCKMSTSSRYDSRIDGNTGPDYQLSEWNNSQQIYYGAAGLSKSLIRSRRANIYAGLEWLVLLRRNNHQEYNSTNYLSNGSPYSGSHSLLTGSDALAAGINPYLGFEYKVCHRFSLGLEITNPFLYTYVYGSQVVENEETGTNTQTTTSPSNYKNLSFSNACIRLQMAFVF